MGAKGYKILPPDEKDDYWNIEILGTGKKYNDAISSLQEQVIKVQEEYFYYMRNKAPSSPE